MTQARINPERLARGMSIELQHRNRVRFVTFARHSAGRQPIPFPLIVLLTGCDGQPVGVTPTPPRVRTERITPKGARVSISDGASFAIEWPTQEPQR